MADPTPPPRPPVRWATHSQHILFVVAVTIGGLGFGLSFTLWPLKPYERFVGIAVLAVVGYVWLRTVTYLRRPVEAPRGPRR